MWFFQRTWCISGHLGNATEKGLGLNNQGMSVLWAKWETRPREHSGGRVYDSDSGFGCKLPAVFPLGSCFGFSPVCLLTLGQAPGPPCGLVSSPVASG